MDYRVVDLKVVVHKSGPKVISLELEASNHKPIHHTFGQVGQQQIHFRMVKLSDLDRVVG